MPNDRRFLPDGIPFAPTLEDPVTSVTVPRTQSAFCSGELARGRSSVDLSSGGQVD